MSLTAQYIEELTARLEYGDVDAIEETETAFERATSDEFKGHLAGELFELDRAMKKLKELLDD